MSEIRIDPITKRQVIFAKGRDLKPSDLWTKDIKKLFLDTKKREAYEQQCPFCIGNEEITPPEFMRYPEKGDWQVRIVPNKFPAIDEKENVRRIKTHAIFERYSAIGCHDVIIESPLHNDNYFTIGEEGFFAVFYLMHQRYQKIMADENIDCVSFFKNYQRLAGASLYHPHSQLIGLNGVPDFVGYEVEGSKAYYEKSARCPYCDILKIELSKRERLVCENEHFAAICPYAPKYKYEVWILPKKHQASFEKEEEIRSLSDLCRNVFAKMNRVLDDFPYNMYLHSLPKSLRQDKDCYHYHFEINPRISGSAGFELGTGIYINSVFPEQAAYKLRKGEKA